jgi:hypothetical protein
MYFKLALVAIIALVLAALAASSGTAFAQPAPLHGHERGLDAPMHPASVERSDMTTADGQDGETRLSAGPVIGLICAIAASSLALGIAFGLRRRIDRIAGPDPDQEDDD